MRLSLSSCTFLGILTTGILATQLTYAQAGSPGRDAAQTKAQEQGESTQETQAKKPNKSKLTPKTDKSNTRRVEERGDYVPTPSGSVPKTPKADCPPAGTGGVPTPDCKEGSTDTSGTTAVPVTKP